MIMMETPTISGCAYTTTSVDPTFWMQHAGTADNNDWIQQQLGQAQARRIDPMKALLGGPDAPKPQVQTKETPMSSARIIKVFIADSNDNLPLDKRVLYSGDEKLTDLTDQELFFEVPIADILAKHNAVRKATIDKKQAEKFGRDIYLEPARIRDLKMVVVTVASF
jgi:hypothetical protein